MSKSHATEAQEVAQEVAVIRAALHQHGYRTRKRPKQLVWIIAATPECYLLTYQPAPISAWVLHPQNNHPNRHKLMKIIHSALFTKPSPGIAKRVS